MPLVFISRSYPEILSAATLKIMVATETGGGVWVSLQHTHIYIAGFPSLSMILMNFPDFKHAEILR